MATEAEKKAWKTDPDAAYADAERLIAAAREEGSSSLVLWGLEGDDALPALDRLPPEIGTLEELEHLYLNDTKITDLAPLSGLTGLTDLCLNNTPVTDLAPLSGLSGLERLELSNTPVSDLAHLSGLTGLKNLELRKTSVIDLAPLSDLTALTDLYLANTPVTDLAPLSGLTGLTDLDLSNTPVTDLAPLLNLTNLQSLDLDGTSLADLTPFLTLEALWEDSDRIFGPGLSFADTPAARADPVLATLSKHSALHRRRETCLYLLGEHPRYGGPPARAAPAAPIGQTDRERITELLIHDPLRLALTDFTYDDIAALMRMAPFPGDMADLEDEALRRDWDELQSAIRQECADLAEDFRDCGANAREAGWIARDLDRYVAAARCRPPLARQLWLKGEALNGWRLDGDVFAFLPRHLRSKLERVVDLHLDLMRLYYRGALSRMQRVEALELTEPVSLSHVNDLVARAAVILEDIAATADAPHAEPDTVVVLRDLSDQNRRLIARLEHLSPEDRRESEIRIGGKAKAGALMVFRLLMRMKADAADFAELSNVEFTALVDEISKLFPPPGG